MTSSLGLLLGLDRCLQPDEGGARSGDKRAAPAGRALKTEFVLQFMSEPLHALARAVYYGQRGRISTREVYDQ